MSSYVLLVSPAANRVYADAAPALTVAELGMLAETVLAGRLGPARTERIAGVDYVTFDGDLTDGDLAHLGQVSTAFALFERTSGDDTTFRPVALRRLDCLDDDLLTILKYQGKTNELFTKLLLHVTVLASRSADRMLTDRLRVLDPLCGRGTTLNQALMWGWHAAGVDADAGDFEAYAAFLPRWLKDKRLKHTAQTARLRRDGRSLGRRLDVTFATSKEAWAAGDTLTLAAVLADTREAGQVFKAASFDVVVTDAPYGVQHGSRSGSGSLQRRPADLLAEAVPGWVRLLKPGGAIGIAVNTRTCSRDDALAVLVGAGLEPRDSPAYRGFEHRVDRAIQRDVVVGCRLD
ncbi:MAG TPA: SAM-dependent methyltransferase [Nocardioides sp.]|nr:SAM-dependent methyltransferase [Nocardioides sp.]